MDKEHDSGRFRFAGKRFGLISQAADNTGQKIEFLKILFRRRKRETTAVTVHYLFPTCSAKPEEVMVYFALLGGLIP